MLHSSPCIGMNGVNTEADASAREICLRALSRFMDYRAYSL